MYPIEDGKTILVQQTVTGTGVFNGSEYGRATAALFSGGDPNTHLTVRAKRYGTGPNSNLVQVIDPGGTYPASRVAMNGSLIEIRLRRNVGGILATAKEISDLINSADPQALPVVCDYDRTTPGDGLLSSASATGLTGGIDPRIEWGAQYKWDVTNNVNAGLFHFENNVEMIVRQMGAKFTIGSPTNFKVWVVNMTPGLGLYTLEKVPLFERDLTTLAPDIGFSDGKTPLLPGQALFVQCNAPGTINFHVRRDSRFPYP